MKITDEHIELFYKTAREVYSKAISKQEGINFLEEKGINPESASINIETYKNLRNGEVFKRILNKSSTEYFLTNIYAEHGDSGLELALQSLWKHIQYNEGSNKKLPYQQKIHEHFSELLNKEIQPPEEVDASLTYTEGAVKEILVNNYERSSKARKACLEEHGTTCQVCSFDFGEVYGEIGRGFIHVHHKVEISSTGKEYEIDPIKDLVPVCPNCHAMLHLKKPAYTIEELKQILKK